MALLREARQYVVKVHRHFSYFDINGLKEETCAICELRDRIDVALAAPSAKQRTIQEVLASIELKVQAKSNDALFRSGYMIGAQDALEELGCPLSIPEMENRKPEDK